MKPQTFFFTLLLALPLLSFSQKILTIEDASGMNRELFPTSLRNLQWVADDDVISWIDKNALLTRPAISTKSDTLFKLTDFNQALRNSSIDTLSRFPSITWRSKDRFTFSVVNDIYAFNLKTKLVSKINSYPENAENLEFSDSEGLLAYTVGNNVFISMSGDQIPVTREDKPGIVNGQTVHRNEFGINKGLFWSPSGKHLAFYRKDESMVTEYPILNTDERVAAVNNIRYPMAGMTSEEVTLVIYHLENKTFTEVRTGEPKDQYLTCVTWGPDEQEIYIALLNRDQNHLSLNKYDSQTGNLVKTLFEEKHEKYVEPMFPLYFLASQPDQFIWLSERDGFQHLYLYNTEGQLIRQLTQGPWIVTQLSGINPKGTRAFFLATRNSPLNQDLFSVDLRNSKITPLSLSQGTHTPIFDKNFHYFIDIYSDTLTCRKYFVADDKGKVLQVIHSSDNPLSQYQTGKMNIFRLNAGDGTELYCRLIYPSDFDPSKKYPVIDYVYGGPHDQLVNNAWLGGANLFLYYLAEQGYIIFTLDNRGSDNRGRDFEQAVFRHLGTLETQDQMVGINYLRSKPWVDPERIGVNGWSYGGFMTISMMLKQPDVFKVGVCGGPVCDWKYYEVMYGERYMDTPEQNPEGYEEASLLNQASKLRGDLLVIHGTADPVVVQQHTLQLMKKFIEEGIQADYFVYPGHEHGVGGKDRVHLNKKIEKYFNDHL